MTRPLIGTDPDQVPINSYLGGLAYQSPDSVVIKNLTVTSNLTANGFSAGGSSGGKATIWVPATSMIVRSTNGPGSSTTESSTNKVMNRTLDFDTTTQEFAQFTIAFPKGWNNGTVTFVPYWTAGSGSGGVVWALQGVAVSNDDVIDAAFGAEGTSTDTLSAANDVHVGPESSAITIGGSPATGDIVYFQIKRNVSDGSDDLGADARLIGVRVMYTATTFDDT